MIRSSLLCILFLGFVSLIGCSREQTLNTVALEFIHPDGSKSPSVSLEVASTDAERMKGLMFRREMAKNSGMIFIFPKDQLLSFWMRNTYLSLDMIFLDESLQVIGVLDHVPPLNEQPRSVGKLGRYVIELNAGRAGELGVIIGTKAKPLAVLPRGV